MQKKHIQLSLPADLNFAAAVRRLSTSIFQSLGFSESWSTRLELVVDEIFMNAVMYGSSEESQVYVHFDYDENEVYFALHDEGKGRVKRTPEEIKEVIQRNEANKSVTKTYGRGLALITKFWTDFFDIQASEHGGIVVSFSKKVDAGTPPSLPYQESAAEMTLETTHSTPSESTQANFVLKLEDGNNSTKIEEFTKAIEEKMQFISSGETLALDFEKIDYINSTLIGNLASWYNDVQEKQAKLILIHLSKSLKDILRLVGLDRIFSLDY